MSFYLGHIDLLFKVMTGFVINIISLLLVYDCVTFSETNDPVLIGVTVTYFSRSCSLINTCTIHVYYLLFYNYLNFFKIDDEALNLGHIDLLFMELDI